MFCISFIIQEVVDIVHYLALIVRSMLSFAVLLLLARLIGQQFKVVVGVAIAVLAALLSFGIGTRLVDGLCVLATWGLLSFALSKIALKSTGIRDFVNGKPTVLIQRGKVLQNNMKKAKLSAYEMMTLLREKSVFKLADVEFGMLEPDGKVSVLLKSNRQPVTPTAENLQIEQESEPAVVIVDGIVNTQALANMGYDRPWLWEQILNQGADKWTDVFLAQVDSTGNVYVDLYDDVIPQPKSQAKPLLLASLRKHQSDFDVYALQTDNPEAKALYEALSDQTSRLIRQVEGFLRG